MTQPQRPGSVNLLVDLLANPLDPGYAAAAARRSASDTPPPRGRDQTLVALGCLLVGFVLVIAYVHQHRAAPEATKIHDALVKQVHTAEKAGDQLDASVRALSSQVDQLRGAELGTGALPKTIAAQELQAGDIAVSGPGVQVKLSDPPTPTSTAVNARRGTTPISSVALLTDRDVRSVVNQLWSDGAEAISVNDVRLTPTSAIRFAGEAVLVDFQPITSPYVIRAIGNPDQLITGFAASDVASRYQTLASADGIGFSFTQQSSVDLPASVTVDPAYAKPLVTPTPSSGAPR